MRFRAALGAFAVVLAACGGAATSDTAAPAATDVGTSEAPGTTAEREGPTVAQPTSDDLIVNAAYELDEITGIVTEPWPTDWTRRTIDLTELKVGIGRIDPRDVIQPIDFPEFGSVAEGNEWIDDREPGVLVSVSGDVRFYPLSILTRHEIVNDVVGGQPLAVTYCPLCNTAVTFSRLFEGEEIRLGVSGLLRNSDLVMWDNATTSLWQQITGEGIVGTHAGKQLELVPTSIVRWLDFKGTFPEGQVLSLDQGFGIAYGANPYVEYSSRPVPYEFFDGEFDERLPALERVVGVSIDGENKAFAFSALADERAVHDEIAGTPIVVLWGASDTADALDQGRIADSQGIGTGVAYDRRVGEQLLTFEPIDDLTFRDLETGTMWSILGRAVNGELEGSQLDTVFHRNEFWFAWNAFFPEAPLFLGS